jgi:hypothetical protein
MFGLFSRKKETEKLKDDVKKCFESVKKDMSSVGDWIKHLDYEKDLQKKDIETIKEDLSSIKEDLEGLKNAVSLMGNTGLFKTPKQLSKQQTAVYPVQTAVQTAVQTPNFDQFSITERAIVWILLNTDMKLSYDDIAVMLGKERSTIRGQISLIKQKSEGLVEEVVEKNGKKRIFIPEKVKENMLKKTKVRVKKPKKPKKKSKKKVSNY